MTTPLQQDASNGFLARVMDLTPKTPVTCHAYGKELSELLGIHNMTYCRIVFNFAEREPVTALVEFHPNQEQVSRLLHLFPPGTVITSNEPNTGPHQWKDNQCIHCGIGMAYQKRPNEPCPSRPILPHKE